MHGAVCLRREVSGVCVNVSSVYSRCQALKTGAPEVVCVCGCVCTSLLVCVKVRSVKGLDSDRLKPSVEGSRLRRVFSTYATDRIHTHARTHTQWSVQGVSVVCSLSLHPVGIARLTKLDWHCQELCKRSVWIYIRALSCFINAFCGEIPSTAGLAVR